MSREITLPNEDPTAVPGQRTTPRRPHTSQNVDADDKEDERLPEEPGAPETDMLHPFGTHLNWNESFYFNVYDIKNDIGAFMRIGVKPRSNIKSMWCFLMMPDGSTVGSRSQEDYRDARLTVGGLSFERIRPEKEWRLVYRGAMKRTFGSGIQKKEVSMELTYNSISRTFDYRECGNWDRRLVPLADTAEHTEQFGRIQGTAIVGDTELALDGLGERDHSWGVRDWLAPTEWIWLSCQFSERCAFNLTRIMLHNQTADAGYVHIDGENRPIVSVVINTALHKDGAPRLVKTWFRDRGGDIYEIEGEVMRTTRLPFSGLIERTVPVMYESVVKYRMGKEYGYGFAEHLTREM